MSNALLAARNAQMATTRIIRGQDAMVARARRARALASSRPVAEAVLRWCEQHPEAVAEYVVLVEALQVALATESYLAHALIGLWSEVPEAMLALEGVRS